MTASAFRFPLLGLALSFALSASALHADTPAPKYERIAPSRDGIGVRYMGREIAQVMGWQGAAWLERSERLQEERTDLLIKDLPLSPGMTVADIGAGTGYIARRIAERIGPQGIVYAVDVQPQMITMLTALAEREQLPQIRPVLGSVQDAKLAAESIDLAIMVDVYHEMQYPFEMLASVARALKPGGRVVFVEYRANDLRVPIKPLHTMSVEQVKLEAAPHPLEFERVGKSLPWQDVIVFRKR